jgi:hypothetical protein
MKDTTQVPGWGALFFGCFGADAGSKRWARRGAWAVIFPALGLAARYVFGGILPEAALDSTVAVSFAAAIGFIYWTNWRFMQDLDEMHQRIMFEALAFSFFGTMAIVVGAGIFGLARGVAIDVLWIYIAAEVLRGVGTVLAARKYR